MSKTSFLLASAATLLVATGCNQSGETPTETAPTPPTADTSLHPALQDVAAAEYSLEKTHAFLTAKVGHSGGISKYRISLTDFDATLNFDPADPESAALTVNVNPLGVETNYPGDYKASHADSAWQSWNEDVSRDAKWLNADAHPTISFVSTSAERTGDLSGVVRGDLTLLGVTKPISLDVTYNGVANAPWFGERDLIGFDAKTTINRSEFGMAAYIPNISDAVTIEFSGEFLQNEE